MCLMHMVCAIKFHIIRDAAFRNESMGFMIICVVSMQIQTNKTKKKEDFETKISVT